MRDKILAASLIDLYSGIGGDGNGNCRDQGGENAAGAGSECAHVVLHFHGEWRFCGRKNVRLEIQQSKFSNIILCNLPTPKNTLPNINILSYLLNNVTFADERPNGFCAQHEYTPNCSFVSFFTTNRILPPSTGGISVFAFGITFLPSNIQYISAAVENRRG